MQRDEIRLKCLEIAAARSPSLDETLARAKVFEEYVVSLPTAATDKPTGPGTLRLSPKGADNSRK